MPPTDRYVIRFAAEPPQETLPYGRWAETLRSWFLAAFNEIDPGEEELGEPGEIVWFPDRGWGGRTYVPATARTSTGLELYGYVSFAEDEHGAPDDFAAHADFTADIADDNPDWQIDVNEEVVGRWKGENGSTADMTLIWGIPLVKNGAVVTAELADLAVDQCTLVDYRYTLIAPDAYREDYLDVKLFSAAGEELARESLYVEDDDEDGEDEE